MRCSKQSVFICAAASFIFGCATPPPAAKQEPKPGPDTKLADVPKTDAPKTEPAKTPSPKKPPRSVRMQTQDPNSFYKELPLFSTRPDDTSKYMQSVDRFGPVGIGIELHPPAFVMKVKNVEPGSPADETGELEAGQIIDTINGEKLADVDPRIQLGNIITKAEATDGLVKLVVRDGDKGAPVTVTVRIPILGAYSKTWPMSCAKSDKIVRNLADNLAAGGWSGRIDLFGPKMLFLLSTGEEKDLDVVREWIKKSIGMNEGFGMKNYAYQWFVSWGGPCLAEYYLRTGDESILPTLKRVADAVRKTMYHDAWGGRGVAAHHMGLAGTGTLTFLLLAKQCGVEVEEGMLRAALQHFYRFAGRGVNPYMDAHPEGGLTDNGRNARLAFAMAAASALDPRREDSLYAKARDIAAMHSFYSSSYMNHGHTGGGIGEVWRSAGMGLLHKKKPVQYREFMDNRTWWYDISRRFNGSFGILGGGSYDKESWGFTMGLSYTAPRKKLCIFGAPRSKYAKDYRIPARPWGTAEDDKFLSLDAPTDRGGHVRNLDHETFAADSGLPMNRRMSVPNITDDELLKSIRHPLHAFRAGAAKVIFKDMRVHLIPELLRDKDARVRYAGVQAMQMPIVSSRPEKCDPGFPQERVTKEILSLLLGMLNDPEESWFVVDEVLLRLSRRSAEELAPHKDRLAYFLGHEEQWLRHAAIKALTPLAIDERHYKNAVAALERDVPNFVRSPAALKIFAAKLSGADPKVQKAGAQALGRIYAQYPGKNADYAGGRHPEGHSEKWYLGSIASALQAAPGGLDVLYEVSKKRFPNTTLPHQGIFLSRGDLDSYRPEMRDALRRVILDDLIPAHIGKSWKRLREFAASTGKAGGREMKQLLGLYTRAGIAGYNWQLHGPKRGEMTWDYHSFVPPEKWAKADDRLGRYRAITFPEGLESWYAKDFDPVAAGWKRGLAPFGSADGRKETLAGTRGCTLAFCGCGEPVNTLWEKDVILLRGTFKFPPLQEGYCYRLQHGGISHVGSGGGYRVYVNGRLFIEQKNGVDRRGGAVAIGRTIPKEWWSELEGGEVTLSVISFMKHHPRKKTFGGNIMISMERMKAPPLGVDLLHKSAEAIPMVSSEWQELQDPAKTITDPEEGKFRYDGNFVPNARLSGSWAFIGQVQTPDDFAPGKKIDRRRPRFASITFKDDGKTADPMLIWSGDTLMDLTKFQAMKMQVKQLGGAEYLFIEAGGFSTRNPTTWKSMWCVMKRR